MIIEHQNMKMIKLLNSQAATSQRQAGKPDVVAPGVGGITAARTNKEYTGGLRRIT